MLQLRKIDCYGQLIVASLCTASIAAISGPAFMIGLFIIGCWQLISAAFNTKRFINNGFKRRITFYWMLAITDLLLLFLTSKVTGSASENLTAVLTGSILVGAIGIAVYYWRIYFKLIGLIALRNELDGLTKSKH